MRSGSLWWTAPLDQRRVDWIACSETTPLVRHNGELSYVNPQEEVLTAS